MELGSRPKDDFFAKLHEELLREGFQAPQGGLKDLRHPHVTRTYLHPLHSSFPTMTVMLYSPHGTEEMSDAIGTRKVRQR
jgi:hypothetical protein